MKANVSLEEQKNTERWSHVALLNEGEIKKNTDTYMVTLDSKEVFDNVKWNELFRTLRKTDLRYAVKRLILNLYKNQVTIIRVEDKGSQAGVQSFTIFV